ncbi:MMPL family transporter [Streptomyces sp. NPDC058335]|uniref:MMPL family transporter n=1 Tax=Streptomyces sp. NPDC058335 TaxID=3346451 RepID=UPI0036591F2A
MRPLLLILNLALAKAPSGDGQPPEGGRVRSLRLKERTQPASPEAGDGASGYAAVQRTRAAVSPRPAPKNPGSADTSGKWPKRGGRPGGHGRWRRVLLRRWRAVLWCAAGFVTAAASLVCSVDDHLSTAGLLPPTAESVRADQAMEAHFRLGTPDLVLLARARQSVDSTGPAAEGRELTRRVAVDPAVVRVRSYWSERGSGAPELRSPDGRTALLLVRLRGGPEEKPRAAERLMGREVGRHSGLEVSAAGEAAARVEMARQVERDRTRGELLAFPVVTVMLLFVFRSVIAALLPVVVGAVAVLGTLAAMRVLAAFTEVSVYAVTMNTGLGFALAVDYSLFMVSRYREERAKGANRDDALQTTWATAGRVVAFSAAIVALSLCALLAFPHRVLQSIAWGGATVVVLAAAAALTVLPALLCALERQLEYGNIFAPCRRTRRRDSRLHSGSGRPLSGMGGWGRLALRVAHRPVPVALAVTAGLVLLAVPFTQVRFDVQDARALAPSSPVARAQHLLEDEFGSGASSMATTLVLPRFATHSRESELDGYARRLSRVPGVRTVQATTGQYADGEKTSVHISEARHTRASHAAWLVVTPHGEPRGHEQAGLAQRLRAVPAPARSPALVGGPGARLADVQQPLFDRLPWVLGIVMTAGLLIVLLLTRRPVLALKALLMNVLSLSATFGALVFVFQEGHGAQLLGPFTVTGTTDVTVPVSLFCITFGLSMDYELLLLSRILEEHQNTGSTTVAVARGLDASAHLFTWAALTFAAVLATTATAELATVKVVSTGAALAVLLDATVVRGLLVPAVMRLAGRANWWSPRILAKDQARPGGGGVAYGSAGGAARAGSGGANR